MKLKVKTLIPICILVAIAIFAVVGLYVSDSAESQEPENTQEPAEEIFCVDLTDYLMIVYFYKDGQSILIVNPVVGYYDKDNGAEVVLAEEKTYCIRNWDYKILYSKSDLSKKELNKEFEKFEF